ncbi:sugar ABC transporter substrate-binding protein [Microbacterium maritypicum]|uniref:sugar ABC transporter substrate-binding protein n=1 Tax=Microbacterium maritypicum TaxID=33918 RepID=UPI00380C51FA
MHNTPQSASARTRRRVLTAATAVALATLVLAACSNDAPSGPSGNSGESAGWAGPEPVEGFEEVPTPGDPIDVSSLKGQTVYWIPITTQAPVFTVEAQAAKEAFAAAGIEFQLCDGKASPDAVSACVQQAINAKAGGVIATSIPPEFAQQSFAAAAEAGLAVEFVNTKDATVPAEWGKKVAALPSNFVRQMQVNGDIIIKDSGGKANILQIGVNDSSVTTQAFEDGMKKYIDDNCPDCTRVDIQTGTTTVANLASQVSAALTKDPGINYIQVEFDSFAPPAIQALRQLNKTDSVKVVTALGQLDSMQRLADGSQFVDTGYSLAALGWNQADIMMRLMLEQDPMIDAHVTPIRTHTKETVEDLDLTEAGWLSGEWSSDDDFRAMFRTLWGVE